MIVETSPHVSAKQVVRWVLPFYQSGEREVVGIRLDVHPCYDPSGGSVRVVLSLPVAEGREMIVLHCEGRADLSGPLQINGYVPGLWTADLHRAAILAYDDQEDDA
jgi:hypothetical protein